MHNHSVVQWHHQLTFFWICKKYNCSSFTDPQLVDQVSIELGVRTPAFPYWYQMFLQQTNISLLEKHWPLGLSHYSSCYFWERVCLLIYHVIDKKTHWLLKHCNFHIFARYENFASTNWYCKATAPISAVLYTLCLITWRNVMGLIQNWDN